MNTFDTFENVGRATVIDIIVTISIWQRLIGFAKFSMTHSFSAFDQVRVTGTFGIRNRLKMARS